MRVKYFSVYVALKITYPFLHITLLILRINSVLFNCKHFYLFNSYLVLKCNKYIKGD